MKQYDGKIHGIFDAHLSAEALEAHARDLATMPVRGSVRLGDMKETQATLRRVFMRIAACARAGDDLEPAAVWLLDNYPFLEEVLQSTEDDRKRLARLPALSVGGARAYALVREAVAHTNALVDGEVIALCARGYLALRGLRMREIWALPQLTRIALLRAAAEVARAVDLAQRDRERAGVLAEKLKDGYAGRIAEEELKNPVIIEHISAILREEGTQGMEVLDQQMLRLGIDRGKMVAGAHRNASIMQMRISNAIKSLHALEGLDWAEAFETLCPVEILLRNERSGIYPRMDFESREILRRQVERFAKGHRVSEEQVARAARILADLGAEREAHVGYYLYGHGKRDLSRQLGARTFGFFLHNNIEMRGRGLYLFLVWFISWLIPAAVLFWQGPIVALLSNLPATSLAVRWAGFFVRMLFKPRVLLKLDYSAGIPDEARTLVIVPALLTSPEQAARQARHLERLYLSNRDANVSVALLGDFADSEAAVTENDSAVSDAARIEIEKLREKYGERFGLYIRPRVWHEGQRRYMGRERKRGAIEDFNAYLLGGGGEAFLLRLPVQNERETPYVLTVDADTVLPPDAVRRMAGAISHPLNAPGEDGRGHAILAPRMESLPDWDMTRFQHIYSGRLGMDTYACAVSETYQDLCGEGIYAGKGIYSVREFAKVLDGKIPGNAVLSHDLIEGLYARAALCTDIVFFDAQPRNIRSWMARLHRWTRGDWQLLPFIVRKDLHALDKWKIADNMRRSMTTLATILCMLLGSPLFALLAALMCLGTPLTMPDLRSFLCRLCFMPYEAFTQADAAIRAAWRTLVSHRRMLDWVTAAQSERRNDGSLWRDLFSNVATGVFSLSSQTPLLAVLWVPAPLLAKWLEGPAHKTETFDVEQREFLLDIARRTWSWFEAVGPADHYLPPDNIQYDPYRGPARRTSPTNIGLAFTADAAARDLGFIGDEQMLCRMKQKLDTLEKLEMWKGHLYNWYTTDTLKPMHPLYVSAVDEGNLAASLWAAAAAARACGTVGEEIARRCENLLGAMDFSLLYDERRRLFFIGFDAQNNQMGDAHYDLLASEARILSYIAIAKGDVPARHFAEPGRPLTRVNGKPCLLSWSGTMFEYLMPRLFLRDMPDTLLDQSARGAVGAQIAAAKKRPWGESESGYYGFDLSLNYQYKAFGVPALSMKGGLPGEQVIAPYATLLALGIVPQIAYENLQSLARQGLLAGHGFYEAADYTPERAAGAPGGFHIIKSSMAHHQGMGLLALEAALGGKFTERFMSIPAIRAHETLLSERVPPRYVPARIRAARENAPWIDTGRPIARPAKAGEFHLLAGADSLYAVDANAEGFYKHRDIMITRFRNGVEGPWGPAVFLYDKTNKRYARIRRMGLFEGGQAVYFARVGELETRLSVAISPEDGNLVQEVTLTNRGEGDIEAEVTAYLEPVLARQDADVAHRAFGDLFLEAADLPGGMMIRRRPRCVGQEPQMLALVCGGDGTYAGREWSRMRFIGRNGSLAAPAGLTMPFEASDDGYSAPIEPCAAVRRTFTVPAGGGAQGFFCAVYSQDMDDLKARASAYAQPDAVRHAFTISNMRASVELGYLGLDDRQLRSVERGAHALLNPRPYTAMQREAVACNRLTQSDLWRFGVSGDQPIATIILDDVAHGPLVREVIDAHEYWQRKGIRVDLIVINDHGNDYMQPVRDRVDELIRQSHLRGQNDASGGVFLINGIGLSAAERNLLISRSALLFQGGAGDMREQLTSVQIIEAAPPPKPGEPRQPPPIPLVFENKYGGFTSNGEEYVIKSPPPAPWSNVIANERFGTLVTETMGGYTWANNSRECKLTPWCNDPVMDMRGEDIRVIRTDDNIDVPIAVRCRHGQGYSVYEGGTRELSVETTVFVDRNLMLKCTSLHLRNDGDKSINIRLMAKADWQMAPDGESSALNVHVVSRPNMLTARNTYRGAGIGFLFMCGASGGESLVRTLTLAAGEKADAHILLGWAQDEEEADAVCSLFEPRESLAAVRAYWSEFLGRITVRTPDKGLDFLVNRWLPYQTLSCRFWGRTAFYQAGGAWGFRDQLQDAAMLGVYDSKILKEQIMRSAAHQFEEGDVQHWWHDPRKGVRTKIRDDMLFLPWAVNRYIALTGDSAILDVNVPYLTAPCLEEEQEDLYMQPAVGREGNIHEHCLAAIREACRFGPHGLPLIGGGDWNDAMNRVGIEGKGESVWLAWFLCDVLKDYAAHCDAPSRQSLLDTRQAVLSAVEEHGWDGGWYRRAFFDDGTPMGSKGSASCEIDLIAQAWGAMTAAPRERAAEAMNAAVSRLYDPEAGSLRLLTPPFGGDSLKAGYIAGYVPGVRENGGQYTHGAMWGIMGDCVLGNFDRAWEVYRSILPPYKKSDIYRVEPYVAVADIYAGEHAGRGGWSWYTGSSAWMWRVAVESLCGLRIEAGAARLTQAMPGWPVEITVHGKPVENLFMADRVAHISSKG